MDRRSALKSFVILSAGVALLPSCRNGKVKGSVSLNKIQLSGDEEHMLASLAGTIVPVKAEAVDGSAHYFVLAMVDDCYTSEEQQKFLEGMRQFDRLSQKQYNKAFVQCSTEQKHDLLRKMESKKDSGEAISYFYHTTRSLALQHYMSSKHYLVAVRQFEMAPGRFSGCFPVQKKSA